MIQVQFILHNYPNWNLICKLSFQTLITKLNFTVIQHMVWPFSVLSAKYAWCLNYYAGAETGTKRKCGPGGNLE